VACLRRRQDFLHQAETTLVALDAKTGKSVWSVKKEIQQRRDRYVVTNEVFRTRSSVALRGEFGVRGSVNAQTTQGRPSGLARLSMGPDSDTLIEPVKTRILVSRSARTPVSIRGRENSGRSAGTDLGLVLLRSALNVMYRIMQPLDLEPKAAAGDHRCRWTHLARDVDPAWPAGSIRDPARRVGLRRRKEMTSRSESGGTERKVADYFDRTGSVTHSTA